MITIDDIKRYNSLRNRLTVRLRREAEQASHGVLLREAADTIDALANELRWIRGAVNSKTELDLKYDTLTAEEEAEMASLEDKIITRPSTTKTA